MSYDNCVICRYPDSVQSYDLSALRVNLELFKMCKEHQKEVEERIAVLQKDQPKKYELKPEPKQFLPPKTTFTNHQDREPGEEG
jgi:hypothetical protein